MTSSQYWHIRPLTARKDANDNPEADVGDQYLLTSHATTETTPDASHHWSPPPGLEPELSW